MSNFWEVSSIWRVVEEAGVIRSPSIHYCVGIIKLIYWSAYQRLGHSALWHETDEKNRTWRCKGCWFCCLCVCLQQCRFETYSSSPSWAVFTLLLWNMPNGCSLKKYYRRSCTIHWSTCCFLLLLKKQRAYPGSSLCLENKEELKTISERILHVKQDYEHSMLRSLL